MNSPVAAISAAEPSEALRHFENKLSFETDCADVHASFRTGNVDFILADVRSAALFEESHVPGALSMPHGTIDEDLVSRWPADSLFVVYCAGPHCNGADRGAARLASLGRRVKIMIGGMTGWFDEGFVVATGAEPAEIPLRAAATTQ